MSKEIVNIGFTSQAIRLPEVDVECPICSNKSKFYLLALRFNFDACGHVLELKAESLTEALKILKERELVKEMKT